MDFFSLGSGSLQLLQSTFKVYGGERLTHTGRVGGGGGLFYSQ